MATKLKNLTLREVSLVDRGANQHAHVTLFKRDDEPSDAEVEEYLKRKFSAAERKDDAKSGAAMRDGSFPIENKGDLRNAIRAYGRAKNKDAAKRHIISRARALGATGMLPDGWVSKREDEPTIIEKVEEATAALAESVASIISGEPADVPGAIESTFKQFTDHLNTLIAATAAQNGDIDTMTTEVEKKLADTEAALAKANETLAKANKELAFAKLSDAHKSYVVEKAMDEAARDAFVAKSEGDRDAQIKAAPVVKAVDPEIAKRDAENADLKKRLAAVEEKNAVAEFAKRAADLGLPEAHGETLRKAHGGDKDAMAKIEQLIKGLTEQVKTGKLFEELGVKGGNVVTAKSRVDAKVVEMQKDDAKLTRAQAIAKIASSPADRELWNAYKAEGVPA